MEYKEVDMNDINEIQNIDIKIAELNVALKVLSHNVSIITQYIVNQQTAWHRMRLYIGCMFWLWIGIPTLAFLFFICSFIFGISLSR